MDRASDEDSVPGTEQDPAGGAAPSDRRRWSMEHEPEPPAPTPKRKRSFMEFMASAWGSPAWVRKLPPEDRRRERDD